MSDMFAMRLAAPGRFERVDIPRPDAAALPAGHVLLRTLAGGVCGSDLPFFRGGTSPDGSATALGFGRPGFPLHEVVGEVVASQHPEHTPGSLVVGWASAFDGIAEYVASDGEWLAAYDTALPPHVAILLQPLACVLYAMDDVGRLGDIAGRHVAVLGQGPIGLLFSHVAAARGASRVTGVDRAERSELGKLFGVDDVVHLPSDRWADSLASAPADERPDVVIEAIGHQAATINHAIDAVAPRGRIFYFGIPDELTYAVAMRTFLRKNLTLQAGNTLERRRMLAAAGAYLREHPDLAANYVTDVLDGRSADEVTEAFERALRPRPAQAKIVITMGDPTDGGGR